MNTARMPRPESDTPPAARMPTGAPPGCNSGSEQGAIKADATPPRPPYKPTPADTALVRDQDQRAKARHAAPRIKVASQKGKQVRIAPDHPDEMVWRSAVECAMGTIDWGFAEAMLGQVMNTSGPIAPVDAAAVNFGLAAMHGIAPRDEAEAMLAAQMVATYIASMTMLRRLNTSESLGQQDSAANAATKLARTYTGQMEALKRYRSRGEQTVRVEHVHVAAGGQAIVGAVSYGGTTGGSSENGGRPHAQGLLTDAHESAMPCPDTARDAVPVADGEGPEAVPHARRREG